MSLFLSLACAFKPFSAREAFTVEGLGVAFALVALLYACFFPLAFVWAALYVGFSFFAAVVLGAFCSLAKDVELTPLFGCFKAVVGNY